MGFLAGKKFLVTGLLSNKSIAYGIASALHREGAELAFTYQADKFKDRIATLAKEFDSSIVIQCDVTSDEQINHAFEELSSHWSNYDGLVHSIAFAPREQLEGDYHEVIDREGFQIAHDISAYSLSALTKAALPNLNEGSSIITLSYLGAEKAVPSYNVMGIAKASLEANVRYLAASLGKKNIRVNAISAGAIKTLAASGIKNFKKMLSHGESVAPLKRNVTALEVGNTAAFLCSDLSSGITGEVVHVDGGYNIMAMGGIESS